MRGNTFGKLFSITSFGESHGPAMGVIIDGMPAGVEFDPKALQVQMDRRRPGRLKSTTSRDEADQVEILSGVFEDKTLGTPIMAMVKNTNHKSQDYNKDFARPGHGDITFQDKFGHRDYRGGGRASGRETLSRVIGGHFASLLIPQVKFKAYIEQVGEFKASCNSPFSTKFGNLGFADPSKEDEIESYLMDLKLKGESAGGIVKLEIEGTPKGLGEPVFDKLKAELAKAMCSIGSCAGIDFGLGFDFINKSGTEATSDIDNFGGIEAGISNGKKIIMRLYFRPPSTVGEKAKQGRHDPCILPRVLPVVEAMAKIVIADHFLRQNAYQTKG